MYSTLRKLQEDALWAEYYAQPEEKEEDLSSDVFGGSCFSIEALPEAERMAALRFLSDDNEDISAHPSMLIPYCRGTVTTKGAVRIFPNGKGRQTSKRRHFCKPKKSDADMIHGNP